MRKNRTMRAAALMLVLTLITACFVGGTFANYITNVEGSDNARVAYWGFGADNTAVVTFDLFKAPDTETGLETIADTNLLAPGTTGSAQFAFVNATGTDAPEVDYKVTVSTAGSTEAIGDLDARIKWKLDEVACDNWADLLADIKALAGETAEDGVATYEAGTAVPAALANDKTHTVSWEWVFDEEGQDTADTALGNATPLQQVELKIAVTVEQVN